MSESKQTLIVDCDGVIADKASLGDYGNAAPLPFGVQQINKLYEMGYHIVLYTARYGDRESGNIHKQYARGYIELVNWLEKHGVKYHEAKMGKPAGAIYIDDKAARVEEDSQEGWYQVWKEVKNLEGKDKYGNPQGFVDGSA